MSDKTRFPLLLSDKVVVRPIKVHSSQDAFAREGIGTTCSMVESIRTVPEVEYEFGAGLCRIQSGPFFYLKVKMAGYVKYS